MKKFNSQSKSNCKTKPKDHLPDITDLDVFDPDIAFSAVNAIMRIQAAGFPGVKVFVLKEQLNEKHRIQYLFNYETIEGVVAGKILSSIPHLIKPIDSEKILKYIEYAYIASGIAQPLSFYSKGHQ